MATTSVLNNSSGVKVVIDGGALAQLLSGPSGPVYRDMIRRGQLVQDAAHRQIRVGRVRSGPGAAGTNLRDTLVKRPITTTGGFAILIGSDSPIALLHHEGTRPHIIRPKKAKMLAFPASGSGQLVFAKLVHHPGTKPNRYLTDNLHLAL